MISLLNKFDDKYVMKKIDILNIISSYISENNLEHLLDDIIFSSDDDSLGCYNLKNSSIILNYENMENKANQIYNKLQDIYYIDDDYQTYFINFYYLFIIFHELTHVTQRSRYNMRKNEKEIYGYLYELSTRLQNGDNSFYDKNHDLFPMEIEANNTGLLMSYKLMLHTKLPKRENQIMYLQYLCNLLMHYKKDNRNNIISPIEKIYQQNNLDINKLYQALSDTRLSKNERLNYGLSISLREYNGLQKDKMRTLIKCK